MSCSLAQAGQGRLVPADGAIQDQSRDWISWSSLFRNINSLEISYLNVRHDTLSWGQRVSIYMKLRADLGWPGPLGMSSLGRMWRFWGVQNSSARKYGYKEGAGCLGLCNVNTTHTESVRGASHASIDFSSEFNFYISLYLIMHCTPNFCQGNKCGITLKTAQRS